VSNLHHQLPGSHASDGDTPIHHRCDDLTNSTLHGKWHNSVKKIQYLSIKSAKEWTSPKRLQICSSLQSSPESTHLTVDSEQTQPNPNISHASKYLESWSCCPSVANFGFSTTYAAKFGMDIATCKPNSQLVSEHLPTFAKLQKQ
jgi:hypothetical protein